MSNLYVYYQLRQDQIALARSAVTRLFTAARPLCRTMRLMQRQWSADKVDNLLTWMEIYEDISDVEDLQQCLQQTLPASGLLSLIHSQRQSEYFFPLE